MTTDQLLKKLNGEMTKSWQDAHDNLGYLRQRERRLEEEIEEAGKELCKFAKRTLALECQKIILGCWCGVELTGPGYVLDHDKPRATRIPHLSFSVSIGGNSFIRYNCWPKSKEDIERRCVEIAKAAGTLKRLK